MNGTMFFLLFTLVPAFVSCEWIRGEPGSGNVISETREVSGFNAIRVGGSYLLAVSVDQKESLVIEGDDNLLPLITTKVENGVLVVENTRSIAPKSRMKLTISAKTLNSLKVSGSLRGSVAGIESPLFGLVASGSCRMTLTGKTEALTMQLSGSGTVDASGLPAKTATVKISGSGKVDVHTTELLSVKISGSGKVNYKGDPKVEKDISGSGKLVKR